jgi:DNA-binding IclR family transcriptional regulator
MITRSVTIEEIDDLYLMWNDHINVSALLRRALREEMDVRDVDPDELRELLERAREQGYTLDEIAENTNRFADLQSLVEDQQNQPPAGDAADN